MARSSRGRTPTRATLARLPRHGRGEREARPDRSPVRVRASAIAMKRAMRSTALRDCAQRCVYCAHRLDVTCATLDHVHPRARGGRNEPGNVVVACGPCNRLKGDLPPQEFFLHHPWAGDNFLRLARAVHRVHKRAARRAVSLAWTDEAWA
jgi:5-methylcytosine-specific restriction endonuclease McrA